MPTSKLMEVGRGDRKEENERYSRRERQMNGQRNIAKSRSI